MSFQVGHVGVMQGTSTDQQHNWLRYAISLFSQRIDTTVVRVAIMVAE